MSKSEDLADGVCAIVKAATDPLFARIKLLEVEVNQLKAARTGQDSATVAAEIRSRLQTGART